MFDLEHRWKVLEFGTVCATIRLWLGTHNGIQGKSCWKISPSAGPTNPRQHCGLIIHKYSWIGRWQCYPRDVSRKERENVGILKKRGGGVYPNPTSIFTVFNMGDPPTINVPKVKNCKINHNFFLLKNMTFPNGGEGGSPTWEDSHIFPFSAVSSLKRP